MSEALVWQLVKRNNAFLYKGLQGEWFSSEPGNLLNKNSYKFSGLANAKTVDVTVGEEGAINVTTPRLKNTNKPTKSKHTNATKKRVRRALVSIRKQVDHIRPDLTRYALARASKIDKANRTIKGLTKPAAAS